LVGQHISADRADIILLETVPENYVVAARKLLEQVESLLDQSGCSTVAGRIRFADNLAAASCVRRDGQVQAALIPAEWSMVFCDSYVWQVVKKAAEEKRPIAEEDIRQALAVLLASLLRQASQFPGVSSGPVTDNSNGG
jgi:hypothetical protein